MCQVHNQDMSEQLITACCLNSSKGPENYVPASDHIAAISTESLGHIHARHGHIQLWRYHIQCEFDHNCTYFITFQISHHIRMLNAYILLLYNYRIPSIRCHRTPVTTYPFIPTWVSSSSRPWALQGLQPKMMLRFWDMGLSWLLTVDPNRLDIMRGMAKKAMFTIKKWMHRTGTATES